ncbi:MAG: hypothetical protein HY666_05405 [Chloroflexi bacterium]|nr:hypothetical protein [Chloroflexota bacterium]
MDSTTNLASGDGSISPECQEAISRLRTALMEKEDWFQSLLEAISLWTAPEEVYQGRHYNYLIGGEAFDWLLLAERLCLEVDGLIPPKEKEALLFLGKLPLELTESEFSSYLGVDKYRAHLSYFYGVTVEESLILATEEEIRKERLSRGYSDKGDYSDDAVLKIYGLPRSALLKTFRLERGYLNHRFMTLAESKEFTYWLFKYRLGNCDRARIASDTKKGLVQLYALH